MKDTKLAIIISSSALIIAIIDIAFPELTIDNITLALIAIAAAPLIIPFFKTIKLPGGMEFELRELKKEVEETRKEVEDLRAEYKRLQDEFLRTCEEYDPEAPKSELDKLATRLKKLASGLNSVDFLSEYLEIGRKQCYKYGTACALQVRPQPHMLTSVNVYLKNISETSNLDNLRLTLLFRLIRGLKEIIMTDIKRSNKAINEKDILETKIILEKLATHERCVKDHEKAGRYSIVTNINQTTKKVEEWLEIQEQ